MVNEWNIMPIQTIVFTVYNLKFPCNINPVVYKGGTYYTRQK